MCVVSRDSGVMPRFSGPGGGGDGGFFGSAAAACVATLVNTISDAIVTVTMATVVGPAAKRDSTPAPTAVTSPLDPAGLLMTFFASGKLAKRNT